MSGLPTTSFVSRRVNPSTFMVTEDDDFGEQPYIYIKLYAKYIVITDSGCNQPRNKDVQISSLRQYIEEYPISCNDNAILNPGGEGGEKSYIIICSHCHYDHILGLPQFLSSHPTIVASELGKPFILQDLPEHSLCKYLDMPTPRYDVSHWAGQFEYFSESNTHFRIQFLQIPGHTPDSLAWYDIDEHYLYIGDTFYTRQRSPPIPELPSDSGQVPDLPSTQAAIIFPEEGGNWVQYMTSLNLLRYFVKHRNAELERQHSGTDSAAPRVLLACGHLTYGADAEAMILEVQELFQRIIAGKVAVRNSTEKRGIIYDYWLESDESCYGVTAPRHLAEEARKHFHGNAK